jgi:penicillin V acylase-like amidase (Ntn superfamily)
MKLAIIFLVFFISSEAQACTTFFLNKNGIKVFGKNYDFQTGTGMLVVNRKGVSKYSFRDNSLKWVSRFGSISFNQYGLEFPSGGMNENGLVIELMWLDGTEYPAKDSRGELGNLQWIQYILDNCGTVQEAIDIQSRIRIDRGGVPLHFLLADRSGNSATIEFLNGKAVFHTGSGLPFPVLTNETYQSSLESYNRKNYNNSLIPAGSRSSDYRFAKACSAVSSYTGNSENAIQYGFSILENVSNGSFTKWQIVYDLQNLTVYYKTNQFNDVKTASISKMDFGCDKNPVMLDLSIKLSGEVSSFFKPLTLQLNAKLISKAVSEVDFLKDTSKELTDSMASFPFLLTCKSGL